MKLPDLTERLKAEIPDHKLDELCTFLVRNVNRSRGVMATNYETGIVLWTFTAQSSTLTHQTSVLAVRTSRKR